MPREGYVTITIKSSLYNELKKTAKKHNRSVPKEIEALAKNSKKRSNP